MEASNDSEQEFAAALMSALPGTIRIGLYDFRVELWNQHQVAAIRRWGECSSVEQCVRFQASMPTRFKAVDTIMHEIMHAIYWAYGVDDDDKEERIINLLATGLAALHRDNPWLTDWLKQAKL